MDKSINFLCSYREGKAVTDQELLKLAAKAEGTIKVQWDGSLVTSSPDMRLWNPYNNDSDAFRLAVRLQIWLDFRGCSESAPSHINANYLSIPGRYSSARWASVNYVPEAMFIENHHHDEKQATYLMTQSEGEYLRGIDAAARLAIVRAAAEIGKAMP